MDLFTVMILTSTHQNHNDDAREIANVATDAQKFVRVFGSIISQSTPHIYVSALPFAPERSVISKQFSGQFPQTLRVCTGRTSHWQATQLVVQGHTSWVYSVAFSPDGKRIVSGSGDNTVRVWDAETGEAVHTPLQGHTRGVSSVAFSPDGKRIVSGSDDYTVRVWDVETGQAVHTPLQGHQNHGFPSPEHPSHLFNVQHAPLLAATSISSTFSSDATHALPKVHTLFTPAADLQVGYQDLQMDDGWIIGCQSQLLIWVPHEHCSMLYWPRNKLVIGTNVTALDLSRVAHGPLWSQCHCIVFS
jgi:WD40 repeat protein